MRVNNRILRSVFWEGDQACWIDQTRLPQKLYIKKSTAAEDLAQAIELMQIRGAPSIGAAAAFGLACAYKQSIIDNNIQHFFEHWLPRFRCTRPTAVNLFHACDFMAEQAKDSPSSVCMCDYAKQYADAEVLRNKAIGLHALPLLLPHKEGILTHCNAGWLAAVDWGTATAGIYALQQAGHKPFVWVDETRPRLQGARLTAWELTQAGIDCRIICDSAAAWMMAQGKVKSVIVGADRIAANGDVANKIGTYSLALAAKAHDIPFYVAAPQTTFDKDCLTGADIPIEERSQNEVLSIGIGCGGNRRIAAQAQAYNPAFDVTPYNLITAIINEHGLFTETKRQYD
ncbi:MAG: S-methyl-5-thioribose-1-phosphate isomerase [Mariprofundales bacterium]